MYHKPREYLISIYKTLSMFGVIITLFFSELLTNVYVSKNTPNKDCKLLLSYIFIVNVSSKFISISVSNKLNIWVGTLKEKTFEYNS